MIEGAREQGRRFGRMSTRAAARLTRALWPLSVLSVIVWAVFRSLNTPIPTGAYQTPLVFEIWGLLLFMSFATVGALVVSRRAKNPVGWIFCALGLSFTIGVASGQYAMHALLSSPAPLPGGQVALWLEALLGSPIAFALFALVLLLFPDGRLLSRRWRLVIWLDFIVIVVLVAASFRPGPLETSSLDVANPFGIQEAGALLKAFAAVGMYLTATVTLAGAVSLLLRFRRSRGDERLQLKWFAFSGAIFGVVVGTGVVLFSLPPSLGPGLLSWLWPVLFLSGASTIPVATGIAILHYRLFDIDVIINRTLVYGVLSVSLVLVYIGCVVFLQYAFRALTGSESQLAVVVSTLAIAALFNPFRRRIQEFIDRRFYRRKYDAAKTLEAFSAKLRDETDLEALNDDLVGVVRETMQPTHASLWLLTDAAPKGEQAPRALLKITELVRGEERRD